MTVTWIEFLWKNVLLNFFLVNVQDTYPSRILRVNESVPQSVSVRASHQQMAHNHMVRGAVHCHSAEMFLNLSKMPQRFKPHLQYKIYKCIAFDGTMSNQIAFILKETIQI